jgi:hypothetical protein
VDVVTVMSFSAWQGYHEGGRRSAAKYNYPT